MKRIRCAEAYEFTAGNKNMKNIVVIGAGNIGSAIAWMLAVTDRKSVV